MADVADRLRSAREHAGLSVDEVAARTRIKPAMLHAIERGDWDQLPGPFFARAFTRTYAKELGLAEADLLSELEREVPSAPSTPLPLPHPPDARADAWVNGVRGPGGTFLSLVLLGGLAAGLLLLNRPAPASAPGGGTVGTSGQAPAIERTVPSAPAEPDATPGRGLILELRPVRPVWITASADGERVLFRTVDKGERLAIEARERMTFRVGDAGAFEYSLNGTPGKPVGRSGEVREFTITAQNAGSYLR